MVSPSAMAEKILWLPNPAPYALAPNIDTYDLPKPFYVPKSEIPVPQATGQAGPSFPVVHLPSDGAFFAEAIMGQQGPVSTLPAAVQQMFQNLQLCTPYVQQAVNNASLSYGHGSALSGYTWAQSTRDYYGFRGMAEIADYYGSQGNIASDAYLATYWLEGVEGWRGPGGVSVSTLQGAMRSLVTAQNALAAGQAPSQVFAKFTMLSNLRQRYGSGYEPLMGYPHGQSALPNTIGDAEAFLKNAAADLQAEIALLNNGGVANVPQVCASAVQQGYQSAYIRAVNQTASRMPSTSPPQVAVVQSVTGTSTGGVDMAVTTPWGNNIGVLGNTLYYSSAGAGGTNSTVTLGANGCGTVGSLSICAKQTANGPSVNVQNGSYSTTYNSNGSVVASGPNGTTALVGAALGNLGNVTQTVNAAAGANGQTQGGGSVSGNTSMGTVTGSSGGL
jgi:hypothetical protein